MVWNYRVVFEHKSYGLRAVYYTEDGAVESWSSEDSVPMAFDEEFEGDEPPLVALAAELERMTAALDKPIMDDKGDELVARKAVT